MSATPPVAGSGGMPAGTRRRVAVVGGGIAGLAAARDLVRAGAEVTLYEPAQLGGKIRTERFAGRRVELGADAFLTRVPDAVALCRELGMEADLVAPSAGHAALWWDDRLITLPSDLVLGAPARLGGVARSGILSPLGVLRAGLDWVLPATPPPVDLSVWELIASRFGGEVADRLVDPLVGGIHAGRTVELSAAATTPQLLGAARKRRSLARALREATGGVAAVGAKGPVFLAPRGGLGELTDRLVTGLITEGAVIQRRGVEQITLAPGEPGAADPGVAIDGEDRLFDGAVLAVPAATAAGLLGPAAPSGLGGIPTATVTMTLLAYRTDELAVPEGLSGFLVPRPGGRLVTACSFASSKWPHWSEPGTTLLRVSVGRDGDDRQDHLDDEALADAVVREMGLALRTSAKPTETRVVRWPDAFPQYRVGHLDLVKRIEEELRRKAPTVTLAGASYRGSGIPACIRSGRDAAAAVLAGFDAGRA
ncbi:MAG: protoporphyrinogen oxidase [Acidimicrobiaceae bacterium]|nr:protoporphyrinogen oxidase [Acidimicrobiaceae bacterium]